ncbi:unnamed protein product [Pleuronectes platessa]|uniref:Uncharacterized protein n=1 Tax=Pleuronectes platessa TaxID=8262 RepID=A0A9N7YL39_PLEPL|nr:unnamed protein product [Pleuronectes platessa]
MSDEEETGRKRIKGRVEGGGKEIKGKKDAWTEGGRMRRRESDKVMKVDQYVLRSGPVCSQIRTSTFLDQDQYVLRSGPVRSQIRTSMVSDQDQGRLSEAGGERAGGGGRRIQRTRVEKNQSLHNARRRN